VQAIDILGAQIVDIVPVPIVDIVDELFVVAAPAQVRPVVCDEGRWRTWFPGISLTPYDDRGRLGVRWTVSGELRGTAEVWLEEHGDGTIVHAYVRATPTARDPRLLRSCRRRVLRRYVLPLKRHLLDLKGLVEVERALGTPLVPVGERVSSASEDRQGPGDAGPRLPTGTTSEGAAPDGRPDDLEHRDRG